jgi:hypothetical protein
MDPVARLLVLWYIMVSSMRLALEPYESHVVHAADDDSTTRTVALAAAVA